MAQEEDTLPNEEAPVLSVEDRLGALLGVKDEGEAEEAEPQEDEVAPPEDTDESPEQDEEDGEEADPEAAPTPKTRKLKVGEQEVEVTEEELEKGYLRQSDYTRKTQDVAEKRKAVEEKEASLDAERQKYSVLLDKLEAQTRLDMGEEPDWDALAESDPQEFAVKYAAWNRSLKRIETIEAEQAKLREVAVERQRAAQQTYLAEQDKLLIEAVPEWKDTEKRKAESQRLREYGLKVGFTEQELLSIADHRAVVLLRNAMLFDEARATAKAPQKGANIRPKVATPGSIPTKQDGKMKQYNAARAALRKSGRADDAVALLDALGIS